MAQANSPTLASALRSLRHCRRQGLLTARMLASDLHSHCLKKNRKVFRFRDTTAIRSTGRGYRMNRIVARLLICAGLMSGIIAEAGVYKCAGQGGGMEYRSTPCPTGQAETVMAVKASAHKHLQLTTDTPKMMMPSQRTGRCSVDYWLLDGVCVHATQLHADPKAMDMAVAGFKQAESERAAQAAVEAESLATADEPAIEDEYCRRYQARLSKAETDHARGAPLPAGTGVTAYQADRQRKIDELRARVRLFCK
mgnify:CR=1 FL=1